MGLKDLVLGSKTSTPIVRSWENYEKLNPAQPYIAEDYGSEISSTKVGVGFNVAYTVLEVVRRGVDLVVHSASEIDVDVKDKIPSVGSTAIKQNRVNLLLNFRPNDFQDTSAFRRNVFMDLICEGNAFIHFDGRDLFHLPASNVTIETDPKTFVKGYTYDGGVKGVFFKPDEVIHIRDNSINSIFRGDSRLRSAQNSINTMYSMLQFQKNFFENGAVPGLVLKTKDILGQKVKDRIIRTWIQRYSPTTGGRRPMILDGGLEVDKLATTNFKELDFSVSITDHEERILKAIGVPPVLLNSGNNANITPNLKLFYLTTVNPLVRVYISAMEKFFGYDIEPNLHSVAALRPELKELAEYYTSLVNNGIMTGKEARAELRLEPIEDPLLDKIRIPANIAGSATGVSGQEGGRPAGDSNA